MGGAEHTPATGVALYLPLPELPEGGEGLGEGEKFDRPLKTTHYSAPVTAFSRSLRKAEKHLIATDAGLAKVIARVGPAQLELSSDFDPFHALVRSICHQQLHGKAAETILGRVNTRFGDGQLADLKKIHRARLPTMRACGLSMAKALAIKDLAAKCLDGTVPSVGELHKMADDEIVERVTQVRGIGRWTVEMMLMFRMGRLDVFPVDDFGVRKGFTLLRGLGAPITPKQLMPQGELWKPYRSVASWYLWRVADGS